ncbi:DUF4919 domain-containing protein [Lacibacterium aquatile]|uniref:DUF4919 domain-containing protein n=1 Tax=Lacibacterium aquatile TaxID=1168082 RepID=A0ABW5DN83_9PROT
MSRYHLPTILTLLTLVGPAAMAETPDEAYRRLMAELKSGNAAIDFQALRSAYVKSTSYDPYGMKTTAVDIQRQKAQSCEEAIQIAESPDGQAALYGFLSTRPHMMMAVCYERLGNEPRGAFHRSVADGLLNALASTGDGKSPETAFKAISISEEYDLLSVLRLKVSHQSLMHKDGYAFDVFGATKQSGDSVTVYFNIDPIIAKPRW